MSATYGAERVTITGDRVAWAVERFATPIVSATRVANGWVFIAADGTVAHGATFLGELRSLGNLPDEAISGFEARGRAGAIGADGSVWTTDGSAPISRVTGLPAIRALQGAFADAWRGAVILDGGEAYATVDGGARWTPVGPPHEAAWWLDVDQGELVLTTSKGILRIDPAGRSAFDASAVGAYGSRPTPWSTSVDHALARLFQGAERATVDRASVEHHPARREWVLLSPSRALKWIDHEWNLFDASTGRWLQKLDRSLVGECTLSSWGEGVGAWCPNGFGKLDEALAFHLSPGIPKARDVVFSDDGLHVAAFGACADGSGQESLCVSRDGRTLIARPLASTEVSLVAMRGARLLLRNEEGPSYAILNVDRDGDPVPLRVAPVGGARPSLVSAWFTGDEVAALARVGSSPTPMLAIGAPDHDLQVRPLPDGARTAGLYDALHGVAAGPRLSQLWATRDGGLHWEPVPWSLRGSPERVRLDYDGEMVTECDATRCRVGGDAFVLYPAATTPAHERIFLGGPPSSPPPAPVSRWDSDTSIAGWDEHSWGSVVCELAAQSPDAPLPPAKQPIPSVRTLQLAAFGVAARIDLRRGSADTRVQVAWSGDVGGTHVAGATTAGPLAVEHPEADTGASPDARYRIAAVDEKGLFFERCWGRRFEPCELFRAANGSAVAAVPDFAIIANVSNMTSSLRSLATADGGALLLHDASASGTADGITTPSLDVVVRLGPDGKTLWRRAFAWEVDHHVIRVLARYQGRAGFAVSARDRHRSLSFYALEDGPNTVPVPLPEIPPGPIAPCRGPRPAGAAELYFPFGNRGFLHEVRIGDDRLAGRASIDLSPGAACLRALEAPDDLGASSDPDESVALWSTPSGEMEGLAGRGTARRRVRCKKE